MPGIGEDGLDFDVTDYFSFLSGIGEDSVELGVTDYFSFICLWIV